MQAPQTAALTAHLPQFQAHLSSLQQKAAIATHRCDEARTNLSGLEQQQEQLKVDAENLKMATALLQELVDRIAASNIKRVEELVNTAIRTIFHDQSDIQFKIISEVKRNTNSYRIAVFQNGVEGTTNSYGGGIFAVIAFTLKILFNILAKRQPIVAFDESLAMLSAQYIPDMSQFIKELTREFNMSVLLVTHQVELARAADVHYKAEPQDDATVSFRTIDRIKEYDEDR